MENPATGTGTSELTGVSFHGKIQSMSTAAILTVVLVLLVLGDLALVHALTRRKRDSSQ
jgi:hypothetical protein